MIKVSISDDRPIKGSKKKFRRSLEIRVSDLKERRGLTKFIQNKVVPFLYDTLRILRDK